MAIRGRMPVRVDPVVIPDEFEDERAFAFRSLDGTNLIEFTGREFVSMWGMTGLDVPKRTVIEYEVPGMDGTKIDDIKVGSRPVLMPVYVSSDSSHLGYLNNRASMRRLLNHNGVDYRAHDGTFDLVATSVLGERSLRCTYVDGMDGNWSQDTAGAYWESFGLNLLACRTYWYGDRWQTIEIRKPAGGNFFGAWPPELSSTRALGVDIPLTVEGDVPSWARVDLVGPCDSVTISAPGLLVTIPAGLAAGETAMIETDPRGRTALFDGEKAWNRVGPTALFRRLQPGFTRVNIVLPGATSDTLAVVSGDSLFETPW